MWILIGIVLFAAVGGWWFARRRQRKLDPPVPWPVDEESLRLRVPREVGEALAGIARGALRLHGTLEALAERASKLLTREKDSLVARGGAARRIDHADLGRALVRAQRELVLWIDDVEQLSRSEKGLMASLGLSPDPLRALAEVGWSQSVGRDGLALEVEALLGVIEAARERTGEFAEGLRDYISAVDRPVELEPELPAA